MAKTIEEKYKSLTPEEHVLHRPGTYIGSTFSDAKLVPASKIDSKRFALKFADGYYKGQYIGMSAGRGRISLSYTQQGARVFSSQKAAEKAIDERYWGVKKYGTLVVEEF